MDNYKQHIHELLKISIIPISKKKIDGLNNRIKAPGWTSVEIVLQVLRKENKSVLK
jgi:hypothetical protein